jgi:probable phosphoglycerate mutase
MKEKKHQKDKQRKTPPTRVLLVRHAMNDWVKTGKLAGRTPGVHLNDKGQEQAAALAERLAQWPITAVYASPLERAQETAAPIAEAHQLPVETSLGIGEVDFGEWTGKKLKKLAKKPLWRLVQGRPSYMRFPDGESFREFQSRAIDEVELLAATHPGQAIVLVSHADVIKAIVAHYLGLHLDQFQRLMISTASLSMLAFTPMGGFVVNFNDTAHLPLEIEEKESEKAEHD